MSEPYIGEIRPFAFDYPPRGWARCDGQLLSISQNTALFSILGTTFGGDGRTTFALPDLRGRVPIGPDAERSVGTLGGAATQVLGGNQLPAHVHPVRANRAPGLGETPGGFPAAGGPYGSGTPVELARSRSTGAGQEFSVLQPYQVVQFCICLSGIFPMRS